jgi:hypothetical protein
MDIAAGGPIRRVDRTNLGLSVNAAYTGDTEQELDACEGELENAVQYLGRALGWRIDDQHVGWQLDEDLPEDVAVRAHKAFSNALATVRLLREQLDALGREFGG